jgi:hypothetical protein
MLWMEKDNAPLASNLGDVADLKDLHKICNLGKRELN